MNEQKRLALTLVVEVTIPPRGPDFNCLISAFQHLAKEGVDAIEDDRTVSYFTVHEEADVIHRRQEREILARTATDDTSRRDMLDAAEASARAMWSFLDGIYDRYVKTAA